MTVYYQDDLVKLYHGDCLDILRQLPESSVDAIVTDPPYGLANTSPERVADTIVRWVNGDRDYLPGGSGFMGKAWDAFVPPVSAWDECLRVLKPGGHLLAFTGSRTHDLMTLGLRLAGFDIRDSIAWLYGSGFPKSLDVSKAIDKMFDIERTPDVEVPETLGGKQWEGWGTALKPAHEPICVARKPLAGTVADNVLEHGTGALNIDGCRIESDEDTRRPTSGGGGLAGTSTFRQRARTVSEIPERDGRWPSNVLLDDTQAAELDRQSGTSTSRRSAGRNGTDTAESTWGLNRSEDGERGHDDTGGASRFFPTFRYEAKAPTDERPRVDGIAHPTVKPLDLMQWLVRLVTPPGGVVLDPFAGSGTTLEAAVRENFHAIGIERETDYLPLIEQRLRKPVQTGFDLGVTP